MFDLELLKKRLIDRREWFRKKSVEVPSVDMRAAEISAILEIIEEVENEPLPEVPHL